MHHPSRLIVTEADYDGFLAKYPLLATYLSNQLITKSAILIGYSLDDRISGKFGMSSQNVWVALGGWPMPSQWERGNQTLHVSKGEAFTSLTYREIGSTTAKF